MRQLGIRLFNAALAAFCCFQLASVVNGVVANALAPEPTYVPADPVENADSGSAWNERKAILDRNLFGAQIIAVAPPPPPPPDEEDVEETRLPLVLEATLVVSGAAGSRATIRDTRARSSMVLGVGDELDNHPKVMIAGIERRRVVLDNQGRSEALLLYDGPSTSKIAAAPPSALKSKTKRRSPRRTRRQPRQQSEAELEELRELSDRVQAGDFSFDELSERLAEMQAAQGGPELEDRN